MEFIVSGKTGRKAVFAELARHFALRPGRPVRAVRTLFDTFDFRLYAAGQRIEEVREAERLSARWLDNASGRVLAACEGRVPHLALDWQPPAAAALGRIIKMRALLPAAVLDTASWPADVLDGRDKTVLRIVFETARTGLRRTVALPAVVRLLPVRGYPAALKQAAAVLAAMPGIARAGNSALERALALQGRAPGEYSSKIDVRLSAAAPAEEAVRAVLARLLETMAANHYGTAADIDTEFLHDFRVAVRRTRSMLGQMKAAVPAPVLQQFRPEFGWLGAVTGPTRDLDVYLLKFDGYSAHLDESVRRDLAPLRRHIVRQQRRQQRALARAITSGRYGSLVESWQQALQAPWCSKVEGFCGAHSARALAGGRIVKLFNRALRQGAALSPEAPAADVHSLRITCKKLRYMLEFFKSLYPPDEIEALTGPLKQLQDVLGDFQDYEVHRAALYVFAEEMAKLRRAGPRTLLAMGRLAESLAARQAEVRAHLGSLFKAFAGQNTHARLHDLFTPPDEASADEGSGSLQ